MEDLRTNIFVFWWGGRCKIDFRLLDRICSISRMEVSPTLLNSSRRLTAFLSDEGKGRGGNSFFYPRFVHP